MKIITLAGLFLQKDMTEEQLKEYKRVRMNKTKEIEIFFNMSPKKQKESSFIFNALFKNLGSYGINKVLPLTKQEHFKQDAPSDIVVKFLGCPNIDKRIKLWFLQQWQYNSRFNRVSGQLLNHILSLKEELVIYAPYCIRDYFIKVKDIEGLKKISKNSPCTLWDHKATSLVKRTQDRDFIREYYMINPSKGAQWIYTYPFSKDREIEEPKEFIETMVQASGKSITWIPDRYLSEEILVKACEKSGSVLGLISPKLKTQAVCDAAVRKAASALKHVPKDKYNKGLIMQRMIDDTCIKKYIKQ